MAKSTHLNLLFQIIMKTYFFDTRCVLMFTDPYKNIENHLQIPTIYIKDIMIHHENASNIFVQFEELIRLKNERFNLRKYVISGENATEVFNTKELEYVSNILVVVPKETDDVTNYDLLTHAYGHMNASNEVVLLDTWCPHNGDFLHGRDLFPNKLHDQKGRVLKIGTFTYEPYSIVEENGTVHGTESSFIFEFVKKYNLTPSFTIVTGDDLWGDIYDNWTGSGILGILVEDEVDVGYGAIYTWEEYYKFLDYSKPLIRTGVTALIPSPQLAAGWLTPLYSFSQEMWMAVLFVFLADTTVLSVLMRRNHNKQYIGDSLLTMVQLYLLQSLTTPIKGRLMKLFIALNMINILLLTSSYSSGLSSVMTVPRYEKAIKTVKDLATSGLPWGAPTDAWLISLRQVEEEDYKVIKRHFVVKNEEDLVASSKLRNFGFSLERLPYGHYAVGPYVKRDVISNYRIMQQDIYWEQCIFVIRKNSVLLPLLDDLILRVFEAGLSAYWENEVVSRYMDMSVQRGIMYRFQEHDTAKLKWTHVEGAFAILVIGYGVSSLAFVLEKLGKSRMRTAI